MIKGSAFILTNSYDFGLSEGGVSELSIGMGIVFIILLCVALYKYGEVRGIKMYLCIIFAWVIIGEYNAFGAVKAAALIYVFKMVSDVSYRINKEKEEKLN